MKKIIIVIVLSSFCFSYAEDQNPVDQAECEVIEATDKLGKIIDNEAKKGLNPCKGEDRPLSERLDTQLSEDAKKIKSFFGFDQDEKKPDEKPEKPEIEKEENSK